MDKTNNNKQKLFAGMPILQLATLLLLGLLACGILGSLLFLITQQNTDISLVSSIRPKNQFIGKWEKYTHPPTPTPTPEIKIDIFGNEYIDTSSKASFGLECDSGYPPSLEFFTDETYASTSSLNMLSGIIILQGGTYEVINPNRIKMQTVNGFGVYQFSIENNTITFTDDANCEFFYEKSGFAESTPTIAPEISINDKSPEKSEVEIYFFSFYDPKIGKFFPHIANKHCSNWKEAFGGGYCDAVLQNGESHEIWYGRGAGCPSKLSIGQQFEVLSPEALKGIWECVGHKDEPDNQTINFLLNFPGHLYFKETGWDISLVNWGEPVEIQLIK